MRDTIASVLTFMLGLALLVGMAVTASNAAEPRYPDGLPWSINENSCVPGVSKCVWDARHRGNGEGNSLLIWGHVEHKYQVITHRRAHRLATRWCKQDDVNCGYDR